MPTPVGHALAGLAVASFSGSGRKVAGSYIAALVICATAPDLDLALRLIDGVNHHRGASHSVTAALLVALFVLVLRHLQPGRWPHPALCGAAWFSHVVLDYLGLDTSPPRGEMALWPFSSQYFASPIAVFYDVPRAFDFAAIQHNLTAVMIEVAILGPIAAICWRRRWVRA